MFAEFFGRNVAALSGMRNDFTTALLRLPIVGNDLGDLQHVKRFETLLNIFDAIMHATIHPGSG